MRLVNFSAIVGPRFDDRGNIVPHSILGSVEEFKKQALVSGDLPKVISASVNFCRIFQYNEFVHLSMLIKPKYFAGDH
jgi:hypothetical protein